MENKETAFGLFLKDLIKKRGITQQDFYTAWGIKKPYFYDIISGRTNPPPYQLQIKAITILNMNPIEQKIFYDLAAATRHDLPADIAKWIQDNPNSIELIRNSMQQSNQGDHDNE